MALFVLTCIDKPNSLELRMATREAHFAYCGSSPTGTIRLGGPFLDENGDMAGSLIIIDVADLAAAQAFNRDDPYQKAGLFERVEIRPWRATFGKLP
ncbi:MAG TPA: YciI family protein [Caulobacteraceae bacterium]|nr:YciI family protein [Caulobacteraceae bacterium]